MNALILASTSDLTAVRVAARLRARHAIGHVHFVSLDDLVTSQRLSHHIGNDGIRTRLRLRDEREIRTDTLHVVFNRLRDTPKIEHAQSENSANAVSETWAWLVGWLASMPCPVLNPSNAAGPGSPPRHLLEFYRLAAEVGFATPRLQALSNPRRFGTGGLNRINVSDGLPRDDSQVTNPFASRPGWFTEPLANTRRHAVVIGGRVFGSVPGVPPTLLLQLLERVGLRLARISFAERLGAKGEWLFESIDAWPSLSDDDLMNALVQLLEEQAQSGVNVVGARP
jgi:hypothetical protein